MQKLKKNRDMFEEYEEIINTELLSFFRKNFNKNPELKKSIKAYLANAKVEHNLRKNGGFIGESKITKKNVFIRLKDKTFKFYPLQ